MTSCCISSHEQLARFEGQLTVWRRKSHLSLNSYELRFMRNGSILNIPFTAIQDLSIGRYPLTVNPAGLDFISITYQEDGQTRRLYFSPYTVIFQLPSHHNQFVKKWFYKIREVIKSATGQLPRETPASQLGSPASSPVLILLYLILFAVVLYRRNAM